jgi:hypothetical protein
VVSLIGSNCRKSRQCKGVLEVCCNTMIVAPAAVPAPKPQKGFAKPRKLPLVGHAPLQAARGRVRPAGGPPGSLFDGNNCRTATTRTSDVEDGSLRMIRLPMVSRDECVNLLRKTRLGGYFQLHQSFICGGGGADQDTCGGDGGSPLICAVPGVPRRFQQVGIVSWGIGCGGNLPGVYVNLAHFREWIDEVMTENGLDISVYRL